MPALFSTRAVSLLWQLLCFLHATYDFLECHCQTRCFSPSALSSTMPTQAIHTGTDKIFNLIQEETANVRQKHREVESQFRIFQESAYDGYLKDQRQIDDGRRQLAELSARFAEYRAAHPHDNSNSTTSVDLEPAHPAEIECDLLRKQIDTLMADLAEVRQQHILSKTGLYHVESALAKIHISRSPEGIVLNEKWRDVLQELAPDGSSSVAPEKLVESLVDRVQRDRMAWQSTQKKMEAARCDAEMMRTRYEKQISTLKVRITELEHSVHIPTCAPSEFDSSSQPTERDTKLVHNDAGHTMQRPTPSNGEFRHLPVSCLPPYSSLRS